MNLLTKLKRDDGIYSNIFDGKPFGVGQEDEILLRKTVAKQQGGGYLKSIGRHHSIPVMDREVDRFLNTIPHGGICIDVGGCWGWHWRRLGKIRSDVQVIIVDLLRENLLHAKKMLEGLELLEKNIFLVHGDATDLPFDAESFDGYWSVQALQHIPSFDRAIKEAFRVLKSGGWFANYSFNVQKPIQMLYRFFRMPYCIEGNIPGKFHLTRANENQYQLIKTVFGNSVEKRYTEVFFKPELGISFMGKEHSIIGKLDRHVSGTSKWLSLMARQQSFHVRKVFTDSKTHRFE